MFSWLQAMAARLVAALARVKQAPALRLQQEQRAALLRREQQAEVDLRARQALLRLAATAKALLAQAAGARTVRQAALVQGLAASWLPAVERQQVEAALQAQLVGLRPAPSAPSRKSSKSKAPTARPTSRRRGRK